MKSSDDDIFAVDNVLDQWDQSTVTLMEEVWTARETILKISFGHIP